MKSRILLPITLLAISTLVSISSHAQFLMDLVDTTKAEGKGILGIYKKYDHLRLSGYLQPQYQHAEVNGAHSFEGGDFAPRVRDRFMLRRSRVRFDYVTFGDSHVPGIQIVFQFDANERGFTVRDIWGRITENKFQVFSLTAGLFARPFGFEVNYSTGDRETPERGRMSQLLMKGERDLGVMGSFEVRKPVHAFKHLKVDLGLFNGQGINSSGDYDNKKDLIGRVGLKPLDLGNKLILSGGGSILYGGVVNNTKYHYSTETKNGVAIQTIDSISYNAGSFSPRKYYGLDGQLKFRNKKGFTEIRGEFINGSQTGTLATSETPVALLNGTDGFVTRRFIGGYAYFLQHLGSLRHQLVLKYDLYDPNTHVEGARIGAPGAGFTAADIKYHTFGAGYIYYMTENVKWMFYYAHPINENTSLAGYTTDQKDDVFTLRLQFRF